MIQKYTLMNRNRPPSGEWPILRALWKPGPSTVREVHELVLAEKGLVGRDESARAHLYRSAVGGATACEWPSLTEL